ncbi:endonuclease/exonuclease/phosphatase family protein [Siccirubricoccus sp. KC 17139]|uniref:Endonuclease/exonuclease/phosphatase family protein n=1 Tax=Siccirubricoccus soli TaxID=2899147 RepID=A0ABT1D3R8_9PROT|nr:endonuclease/exonuclease/phosphatase family protein [Siccirubricoccus soli]MCO6416574.1 endonuclease/exonuclease/phosphatase family protein [Siccirubricoccus soli]MCP2682709.1 endonuclease/exonuclease/phosphatase family protein [Siccirubricoccus soli]
MRLASYNVENLFERARALNLMDRAATKRLLEAQAGLNATFRKPDYTATDRRKMAKWLEVLGLGRADESKDAILRQNRGRLRQRKGGKLEITATGGEDWVGWVELKTEPVNAVAIDNTARIIALLRADLLAVVEAESRPALRRFASLLLPGVDFAEEDAPEAPSLAYPRVMLVDGNDDRGIDVGLMATEDFAIRSVSSHVDDRDAKGGLLFSRDCADYEVALPSGGRLHLLVNHFKSQGYGARAENDARRRAQAERVRAIYEARLQAGVEFVAVLGDLNDRPDSPPLAPLLGDGGPRDVSRHPNYRDDGRPGTWRNGTAANKLDYILLSPGLWDRVQAAGVERRGVWGGTWGTLFPHLATIAREEEAASDHAAIWVDLGL